MHVSDYYREQAAHYRKLAEEAKEVAAKQEYLELATACDEGGAKWIGVAHAQNGRRMYWALVIGGEMKDHSAAKNSCR
jgi:hypothetical protein